MFLVTGDVHSELARFSEGCIPGEPKLTAQDYMIVCGDFGFVFANNDWERRALDRLAEKPYTILFVDGNHENFDTLNAMPVEMWCGGKVHRLRPNVIHLMRGQVYDIEGKRFFTFGGANSIDRAHRIEGYSWWAAEMPSQAEMDEARVNLARCGHKVDYILTHAAPEDTMCQFHPYHGDEVELNFFLEWVRETTEYKHWYFGHLHDDRDLWRNQTLLWFDVRNLETNEVIERDDADVSEV